MCTGARIVGPMSGATTTGAGRSTAAPAKPAVGPPAQAVQPTENEALDRFLTGTITVVPILLLVVAGWQVWNEALHWRDLVIFAVLYSATALGITVGSHRLLPHRAFTAGPRTRGVFAILGSAAIEGPVIAWVADHRKHHACSDREGDPHSPHVGHGHGVKGAFKGFF